MPHLIHITINPHAVIGRVSPYLTGTCMEDVNHEVYGGAYSQMIFGESFEEQPQEIDPRLDPAYAGLSGAVSCRAERTYLQGRPEVRSWQPFRLGGAEGHFTHTILRARRGPYSQKIEFLRGEGAVGIENRGLNRWGINLLAGRLYEGLLTLQAEADTPVLVALQSGDGSRTYAQASLALPGDKAWHTLPFRLRPDASDPAGRLAIMLQQPGALWVDYVLLQPAAWGRFRDLPVRRDIADALVTEGLTVMRYGGYMINTDWEHEARSPGSGYRWKKMTGPRQDRPPYLGTFYPYNSNGFGVIDFVALCEAAGFLCVPAISPSERPEDVADLVEYLNGDAGSPWGARRAAGGHREPYRLRYLQIGNEELTRAPDGRRLIRRDYPERFAALLRAAASRDPGLTLIASPWLYNDQELTYEENRAATAALLTMARGHRVLWDVHVGGDGLRDGDTVERFIPQLRAYLDAIDRDNKVRFCILEENGVRHDMQRALGHAHIINTVTRLAGEVVIDCPANALQPWQENDNFWDQGQLFFTPTQVWGMPPYYAQQMIARHYQPLCIRADAAGDGEADDAALDITATRSENGRTVVLKIVNLQAQPQPISIDLGTLVGLPSVRINTLSGPLEGANSPQEPRQIAPVEQEQTRGAGAFEHVLPGHSFTVLQFS